MFKTQELCRVIQRNKKLIASKFCQCSTHGPAGVSLGELNWGKFWPPVNDFLGWHLYAAYKAVKLLQSEGFKRGLNVWVLNGSMYSQAKSVKL
jgi:hypothetical protein